METQMNDLGKRICIPLAAITGNRLILVLTIWNFLFHIMETRGWVDSRYNLIVDLAPFLYGCVSPALPQVWDLSSDWLLSLACDGCPWQQEQEAYLFPPSRRKRKRINPMSPK